MFVDSSALAAILANERDADELARKMEAHPARMTSPLAVWETVIVVARILNLAVPAAERLVAELLERMSIRVVAVPPECAPLAIGAHRRYGSGRHPAALNFGDCFAYACARHHGVPLLYKGDDFSKTDIMTA